MINEKKPEQPKYVLPSQRILDAVKTSGMTNGSEIAMMIELAILDKLDEVALILRSFQKPIPVVDMMTGKQL